VSAIDNPFLNALKILADAGVEFVVVGVGGINFYARDPGGVVLTQDLDLLLAPRVENLRTALVALGGVGFGFSARGEPFVDLDDLAVLANIVRNAATLTAANPAGAQLDLMLSASGFRYEEWAADAETFRLGEVELRVGRLEKLLRSKELSARPKDVEFLRLYAARLRTPS
jgi:hypothetical protein